MGGVIFQSMQSPDMALPKLAHAVSCHPSSLLTIVIQKKNEEISTLFMLSDIE